MRLLSLLFLTPLLALQLGAETKIVLNKTSASEALDVQQVTVAAGEHVTLSVPVLSGNFWLKDGRPIPGATGGAFIIESATSDDTGVYRLSYEGDQVDLSQALVLTVSAAGQPGGGRLQTFNLRGIAGSGAQTLVAGFIVSATTGDPTATKRILVRAVGPTLETFGVSGFLMHPQLRLFNTDGKALLNSPADSLALAQISLSTGAFPLKPDAGDQVFLFSVPAGAYTAQLTAPTGESGAVILEVYEVP